MEAAPIVVYPILYMLDVLEGDFIKAGSLREETANEQILIFVAPTLIGAVWMAEERLRPLLTIQRRAFRACAIRKSAAVINGDGLEYVLKCLYKFTFQLVERLDRTCCRFVRHTNYDFLPGFSFCHNQEVFFDFLHPTTVSISQWPNSLRSFMSSGRFSILLPRGLFCLNFLMFLLFFRASEDRSL